MEFMEEIKKHSLEFQKEWKEFMTLNKMEWIKRIQWNNWIEFQGILRWRIQ